MTRRKIIVGVGDMKISNDINAEISTLALGSCIGVAVYDPIVKVGGILHYMLPDSRVNPQKAIKNPYMFADTGIPRLFKKVYEYGAKKYNLIVKVAGGASILDDNKVFDVGKRNYLVLRKIFWKNNVLIDAEAVGGTLSRTMYLFINDGTLIINSPGKEKRVL